MNSKSFGFASATIVLLASCASQPTQLSVVGPPPNEQNIGYLQVFSPVEEQEDSERPVFFRRHMGYSVFASDGKPIKQLKNAAFTSEEDTLELVPLPTGHYLVKISRPRVSVPVIVEPGRTTVVHLDGAWKPPTGIRESELVSQPRKGFVGWRGDLPEESPKR